MTFLNVSINPVFIKCLNFFFNFFFFFIYIKMSKDLSAKYYQGNKEKLQTKAWERYQNL